MYKVNQFRFLSILGICILFGFLGIAVMGVRLALPKTENANTIPILDINPPLSGNSEKKAECLVLWSMDEEFSCLAKQDLEYIMADMRIGLDFFEVSGKEKIRLEKYDKVVVAMSHYSTLEENLFLLEEWVEAGGNLLLYMPPEADSYFSIVKSKWGIREIGKDRFLPEGIRMKSDLLLGGRSRDFAITTPAISSLIVRLSEECLIHIVSSDKREIPLLWEKNVEKGRIVFCNIGEAGKDWRGIYAAAYSLLGDFCIYPVINGSAFYLDCFPAPVLAGDNEFIKNDYNLGNEKFLKEVWWPEIFILGEQYGVKYTGMLTENFNPVVQAPFLTNRNDDNLLYFGRQLLQNTGALELSGYNTVPLSLEMIWKGVPYYKSTDDMALGLQESIDFIQRQFPKVSVEVIAPPANVLSSESRLLLRQKFPNIRAVAGTFMGDEKECVQEFGIAEDGLIETPRIFTGYDWKSTEALAALSELNLHFVSSHRQIIYDLPAQINRYKGWEATKAGLKSYMEWLYDSSPDIRRLSGREMAAAVQRFSCVDIVSELKEDGIAVYLDGFEDEAWFLFRFQSCDSVDVSEIAGGSIVQLTDSLYLVKAEAKEVFIPLEVS